MARKVLLTLCCAVLLVHGIAAQETFRFQYQVGDKYRILSQVDQSVTIDGQFLQQNHTLNRIAVEVTEVQDGAGLIQFDYQHSNRATSRQGVYESGDVFHSEFWRDPRGTYRIDPKYLVPPTQNIPLFPERAVEEGGSWAATGTEVYDLPAILNVPGVLRVDVPVQYEYLGMREWKGSSYPTISIRYNVFYRPTGGNGNPMYPVLISGYSHQTMYWNPDIGQPKGYEEEYTFVFVVAGGSTIVFEGTASSELILSKRLDRSAVKDAIEKDLKDLGVKDAGVSTDERGVTITLDNIQFPPDSAVLIPSEQDKLRRIAEILKKYPDRDILITGHTALAGTAEGRQRLSEERAASVGRFLLDQGVRDPDRLLYKGMGAREPVADNSTEAGMRKNRRVEITIMEN